MIIGISGKRGVGKTTAGLYLVRKHGFQKVSFADDLRLIARNLFPFTDRDFGINKEKKFKTYDWSPREFMIHLGEFMRFHDSSFWLNRGLTKCSDPKQNYVFDDLRYVNEADAVIKAGGRILRIDRYEKLNPHGKDLDTPSETELDTYKWDYHIAKMRNLSIPELESQLDGIMEEVLLPKV